MKKESCKQGKTCRYIKVVGRHLLKKYFLSFSGAVSNAHTQVISIFVGEF